MSGFVRIAALGVGSQVCHYRTFQGWAKHTLPHSSSVRIYEDRSVSLRLRGNILLGTKVRNERV
jgi:hypothetical protein